MRNLLLKGGTHMARSVMNERRSYRRILLTAAIAVLLLGVTAAQGAEVEKAGPPKPAWKWTLDERLGARFDPGPLADREAEHEAEQEALRKRWSGTVITEDFDKMTGPPAATEALDGSKTPELFLPVELFGMLLRRGLPLDGEGKFLQESRSRIEQRAAALGFGRDLWDRLEKAAAPYLRPLQEANRRDQLAGANTTKEEETIRLCRLRAQALEAAKTEFGEEAFLRLLYEVVAPNARPVYVLEGWPPDYHGHAERLRFYEGGCR
ncbi:MAG TPA: hypothetical protein VKK31_14420 [Thermoanaerobaculia bacterium]|nr:hypothetical protein [Thermoanaerobaculia bacterium]